jgi:hypothetical protein
MSHIYWVKVPLVATMGLCRIAMIILPSTYICLAMFSNAVVTVCGTNMLTLYIASFQSAQRAATKATRLSVLVSYGVVLKSRDEPQQPINPLWGDLCALRFLGGARGDQDRCLLPQRITMCLRPRMLQQTVNRSL